MCELLGMSANVPTDIRFSFTELIKRGGGSGPHRDGWGIAFYESRGCRTFHDPKAGVDSEVARLVRMYPIKSRVVISHVRKANRGKVCLENTHPFTRELWGHHWCYAHNGQLKGIKKRPLTFFKPVGTTDSEHAFCWLMDQIRHHFPTEPRSRVALARLIAELSRDLAQLGVFNMLLSDSHRLYAFGSTKLCWITRRAPFGKARLKDADLAVDFQQETTEKDVVSVVATRPLTRDEAWTEVEPGSLVVFRDGEVRIF